MSRFTLKVFAVFTVVMLLFCMGGTWVVEVAAHLILGWTINLRDVLPRVTVDAAAVAVFALALPVAAWLAHSTLRWLWQSGRPTDGSPQQQWRWKWTGIGLSGVMLMFVAGVAATGVVHQTGWLLRSPVPLLAVQYRPEAQRIKCSSNLRQIALGILIYVGDGGHWPTSRGEMARLAPTLDLTPDVFVCPNSPLEKAPGTQPSEWAARLDSDQHFSYVVCPHPLSPPTGKKRVMVYEPLDLHQDGLHVLYEDGTVDWLEGGEAERWLAQIDAEQNSQRPATTRATP